MSSFLRALLTITVVMHVPVAFGLVELFRRLDARSPATLGVSLAALGVALFVGRARAGMPDRKRNGRLLAVFDIPYFIHWCACLFGLIPSAVATVAWPFVGAVRGGGAELPWGFYMWVYLVGLGVCGYGVLVRRRWFHVKHIDVPIEGLPDSFNGYRIAHLSDLHIGTLTPAAWAKRWTRAANACAPDLAVVTGDMVTSGTEFHEDIAEVVATLWAKDGTFVSMGNHDYFGDGEPLISMLTARGVRVLRNAGTVLARGESQVYLAGIDDTWTRRDDIDLALRGRPDGAPVVLLAHDPVRFPAAVARRVALTLSGHTHGGQIAMPFVYRWLSLSRLAHRFHVGLYRHGPSTLYVHPGLGTTGPPIRLGVAPVVAVLTLRAAPAQGASSSLAGTSLGTHSKRARGTVAS